MIFSSIQNSKFGYFYLYCINEKNKENNISNEINNFIKIIQLTNNLSARSNAIYNRKILRKSSRLEKILMLIVLKNPNFLITFEKKYCSLKKIKNSNNDAIAIAEELIEQYNKIYAINFNKNENSLVIVYLNDLDIEPSNKDKKLQQDEAFKFFLTELKNCHYQSVIRYINRINYILNTRVENKGNEKYKRKINELLKKNYHNINIIFVKGLYYPFRKEFTTILAKFINKFDIKENSLTYISKYLKESMRNYYISKNTNYSSAKKLNNFGYLVPEKITPNNLAKINNDLILEKEDLISRYNKGELIEFNKPYLNTIQSKKVDIINSFFDKRFKCELNNNSNINDFVNFIIKLSEKADELVEEMFIEVLFEAHDSPNLLLAQSYEKNESMRILYSLYSSEEKMKKYAEAREKFYQIFEKNSTLKQNNIIKEVAIKKSEKDIQIDNLIPDCNSIINDLIIRESKFIDSHAVEEFKHKALNHGKYLNYDLEIIARDISALDLPKLYEKIKRNIMYTNFVEEIEPGEDREEKYREARIVRNKTLAVAQEMIAKMILNKNYSNNYDDISYDEYQNILNSIYTDILHEKKLTLSYDNAYDELEILELNYLNKKKEWDENSSFVRALYLIIYNKGN